MKSLAINCYLILLAKDEFLKVNFLPQLLLVETEATLYSHKVVNSMCIYLPFLHCFMSSNRFCILCVQVVVRYKYGEYSRV